MVLVDLYLADFSSPRNAPDVNTGAHPALLVCHTLFSGAKGAPSVDEIQFLVMAGHHVTYL